MADTEAPTKRPRRPWYVRWAVYLLVIYGIYCGLLFFIQHKIIFPGSAAGKPAAHPIHADIETLELTTPQGKSIAWYLAPAGASADEPVPLVVILHGNAELIDHQHFLLNYYNSLGFAVLLPEYRGYGRSEGSPSQATIVPDVVAFHDMATARPEVDAARVVIHGRSIGGAIAAQLADQRKPSVLIVQSTGASVAGMSWKYGVPPFIVRSPFNTARVFETLDIPVLILHGQHDGVFPYSHAKELLAAAPNAILVPFNSGHGGIPRSDEFERYDQAIDSRLRDADLLPDHEIFEGMTP